MTDHFDFEKKAYFLNKIKRFEHIPWLELSKQLFDLFNRFYHDQEWEWISWRIKCGQMSIVIFLLFYNDITPNGNPLCSVLSTIPNSQSVSSYPVKPDWIYLCSGAHEYAIGSCRLEIGLLTPLLTALLLHLLRVLHGLMNELDENNLLHTFPVATAVSNNVELWDLRKPQNDMSTRETYHDLHDGSIYKASISTLPIEIAP